MNYTKNTNHKDNRIVNKSEKNDNTTAFITAVSGNTITFKLLEHETKENDICTFKLVNHIKANKGELSLISPIGQVIHKKSIGDTMDYTINSNTFTVTILNIVASK